MDNVDEDEEILTPEELEELKKLEVNDELDTTLEEEENDLKIEKIETFVTPENPSKSFWMEL